MALAGRRGRASSGARVGVPADAAPADVLLAARCVQSDVPLACRMHTPAIAAVTPVLAGRAGQLLACTIPQAGRPRAESFALAFGELLFHSRCCSAATLAGASRYAQGYRGYQGPNGTQPGTKHRRARSGRSPVRRPLPICLVGCIPSRSARAAEQSQHQAHPRLVTCCQGRGAPVRAHAAAARRWL